VSTGAGHDARGADPAERGVGRDADVADASDGKAQQTAGVQLTLATSTPDDTRRLAAVVASEIEPGDAIVLGGELGAGKTCFVQGAARQLGVTGRVTSPTFTLIRSYPQATPPIVHVDIYRLNRLHDVVDLGDEVFDADSVTFIEWGDAAATLLPDDRLDVEMLLVDPEDVDADRQIVLRGYGSWAVRLSRLEGPLATWHDGAASDAGDARVAGTGTVEMNSPDTGTDT